MTARIIDTLGRPKDRLGRPNSGWKAWNERRPPSPYTRFEMRLEATDDETLSKLSRRFGQSKSELIRTFVQWGIETELRELKSEGVEL
jgi:hypothetical protein